MNKNKKTQKTGLGAFDALVNEALEDDFLNPAEDEGVMDEYEDEVVDTAKGDEGGEDVTITVTADQAAVLKDVLSQLQGEDYEDEDTFEPEDEGGEDEDVTDIEELEKESTEVYSKHGLAEKGVEGKTAISKTKSGKAADNTGELEGVDGQKMGEEQQYKFVKRGKNKSGDVEKPEPKKYKVVSGSKSTPDDRQ